MDEIQAPFTEHQVDALNAYQAGAGSSAVRCASPAHSDGTVPSSAAPALRATRAGWLCPVCGHMLHWAPASLLLQTSR